MDGMGNPHQIRGTNTPPSYDQVSNTPPQGDNSPRQNRRFLQPTIESKIVVMLLIIAAIVVMIAMATVFLKSTATDSSLVKSNRYQAVFLSNGQVYFGKITGSNSKYLTLEDIYYLQVDQQVQPAEDQAENEQQPQVSLAKLGNELHGPEDMMFISTDDVIFWENLKDDGKVVTAIREHKSGASQTNDTEGAVPEASGN